MTKIISGKKQHYSLPSRKLPDLGLNSLVPHRLKGEFPNSSKHCNGVVKYLQGWTEKITSISIMAALTAPLITHPARSLCCCQLKSIGKTHGQIIDRNAWANAKCFKTTALTKLLSNIYAILKKGLVLIIAPLEQAIVLLSPCAYNAFINVSSFQCREFE